MLNGERLAAALREAMAKKGVRNVDLAHEFGVKPPTISSDWRKKGRIGKRHIDHLIRYFSDTVPRSHWGLSDDAPAGVAEPAGEFVTVRVPREKWEQFELFLQAEHEAGKSDTENEERHRQSYRGHKDTNSA
ncbi:MAG: helix-turn-helix domain-containing protein [Algiphilus sp.]|uniref:helix-turn-helix domain-containing protein n=1 Tax=Algiphilus sp. TaxID=1872431 RepID=UPI0032EFA0E2